MGHFYRTLSFLSILSVINGNRRCHFPNRLANRDCQNNAICNRTYTISYMSLLNPLYEFKPLDEILNICCGPCVRIKNPMNISTLGGLGLQLSNSSDFVFPVLGSTSSQMLHGYHFIPFIDAPSLIYLTQKDTFYPLAFVHIVFPIFFVVLLMSMVAGFIIWCCEKPNNEGQFPKGFLIGWFHGTWFCFVSLTTVGYGDKITRSATGKLFTIFWMFTGVVIFALTTSLMTSEINHLVNTKKVVSVKDRNIGIVKNRDYESYVLAKNGGFSVQSSGTNFDTSLLDLIRKLQSNDIDGVLIDRYTAWHLDEHFLRLRELNDTLHRKIIYYYLKRIDQSEFKYKSKRLSYGFLAKDKDIYNYLNDAIRDNQVTLERQFEEAWLKRRKQRIFKMIPQKRMTSLASILLDSDRTYFESSIIVLLAIIGLICLFGIFYEIKRKLQDEKPLYQETNLGT